MDYRPKRFSTRVEICANGSTEGGMPMQNLLGSTFTKSCLAPFTQLFRHNTICAVFIRSFIILIAKAMYTLLQSTMIWCQIMYWGGGQLYTIYIRLHHNFDRALMVKKFNPQLIFLNSNTVYSAQLFMFIPPTASRVKKRQ